MSITSVLIFILIGLIAGWLAGKIWQGSGFGFIGDIVIGVVGSFLGGFLFRLIGISFHGIIGSIIAALIGALILLFIINQFKK